MFKYMNYINLYNRQKRHEQDHPLPNTRFHPYGRGGDPTHELPKENRTVEGAAKEDDVPNLLPHHRLP